MTKTNLPMSVVNVTLPITGQRAFYNGTIWEQDPSEVLADPAVPNGTTDNTTYLQECLVAAMALGAKLRIPAGTGGNWIINHFTIPSNAVIDATGAMFAQLAGVNTRMLLNTSLTLSTPGTTRDTNISWTGGTFVKGTSQTNVGESGAGGLDDHVVMFAFVDGLSFNNYTVNQSGTGGNTGTGGRFGFYLWNCTNFVFENYRAYSTSLAVNQSTLQIAYSSNGHIKGIYGSFGDDMVAVVNGNAGSDLLANGYAASEDISIEDVFGNTPSTGVKLMGGSTNGTAPYYNVQRCSIKNVRGSFASRGGTGAIFLGGSTNYPYLDHGYISDVEVENVMQLATNSLAVYVGDYAEVHGTVLRRINNQQDSTAIQILSTGNHSSITIADCEFTTAITSGSYYPISVTGTLCRMVELENIRVNAATTGTATVAPLNAMAGPGYLVANAVRVTGRAYALGVFASTTRLFARAIEQEDNNGIGWFVTNTGAALNVMEWSCNLLAGTNSYTQTAGTVTTKTSSLPGASGTAILGAGTVTVTAPSTLITAVSQIRLTTLAPNGTIGHCYVATRSAGSFTITSTSSTDTSTIFWEIVSS